MWWLPTTIFLVLALAGVARSESTPLWQVIDEESRIAFTAMQAGAAVEGRFERFDAELRFDPDALTSSSFRVEVDIASVESGNADRDSTLKSNGFFDVAQWPTARFEADEFVSLGSGQYEGSGTLTIRDRSLPIVLPFRLELAGEPGERLATADATVTMNRLDYGVGQGQWADTSIIADAVVVSLRVVAREVQN